MPITLHSYELGWNLAQVDLSPFSVEVIMRMRPEGCWKRAFWGGCQYHLVHLGSIGCTGAGRAHLGLSHHCGTLLFIGVISAIQQ